MGAHEFDFTDIDGEGLALSRFAGCALLVVNTASECGYTPQYEALEALWEKYKGQGLVVLGVPSNDFGGQEPADEQTIKTFCQTRYGVSFPMTAKTMVVGAGAHPFYRWVEKEFGEAATPRWNFHKYLLGADGELRDAWPSAVEPLDPRIASAVEAALGETQGG